MKVLVVDDDSAVADVIAGMLEDLGCEVEISSGVQPALHSLSAGSLPDLIISDIRMPGAQDGIDLARQVMQEHPTLPVILMTGYSDRIDGRLNLRVLAKPVSEAALIDALGAVRPRPSP